ncbi:MAG TPA: DUF4367 domain-containing protein [Candidatus Enterenecus merdae]|nr:DUF4367 domain-containing protein [Candidatus Enterenecus merdae]
MGEFEWRDQALEQAAALVVDALLESLPNPEDCQHVFSNDFEEKMRQLMRRQKGRRVLRTVGRRVAAAILALLIGLGAWLAADQNSRAAVLRWIREVYENSVIYRFFGAAHGGQLPAYRPTWVPEGYLKVQSEDTGTERVLLYQDPAGEMGFVLVYHWMDEGHQTYLDATMGAGIPYSIRGNPGDYYPAAEGEESNALVWIDEDAGILFSLSSNLSELEIVHIAECIELVDSPK